MTSFEIVECVLVAAILIWGTNDYWKAVKEARIIDLYADFSEKIDELIENPFTFDRDWKELIPVLEFADSHVRRRIPWAKFGSLAERARRQTYDYGEEIGA